jgi:hypothetical protein
LQRRLYWETIPQKIGGNFSVVLALLRVYPRPLASLRIGGAALLRGGNPQYNF